MSLTEKQTQRVDGILVALNDFLDKRFSQAKRVNPKVGAVEADIRWHNMAIVRQVLEGQKGFGPIKLLVADILASADEEKKRALFNPVDQVSVQNEIVPDEDEAKTQKKTAGQLEIRNVSSYYRALDPSLEKVIRLMQTWVWWDLRDSSDMYRFEVQEQRLANLRTREVDASLEEYYRKEMNVRPGVELVKQEIVKFEMERLREIVSYFQIRRNEEHGYQMIVVSEEREGTPEADAMTIKLAKRLTAVEKIRAQGDSLDENVRKFYAPQLGLAPEQVSASAVLSWEESLVRRDRQQLHDLLSSQFKLGRTISYKQAKLEELHVRMDKMMKLYGMSVQKPATETAPVAQ